jgi:hypothetical protein
MPEYIYHKPMRYQVDAAETLKEIGEQPHMLLRIGIRGGHFPHRNAPAFARIHDQGNMLHALYCEIDDDESGFRAYFATDVALKGVLSVGFENDVVAEFELERLTPFHRVTLEDPGVFKRQQ